MPGPDASLRRWAQGLSASRPAAVIMGGSVNGLSFVRSLSRRGIATLLLDSERLLGTYTRFGRTQLLPPVDQNQDAWLELLTSLGSQLPSPAVLFATSDSYCGLLAHQQGALSSYYRFLTLAPEGMERILDKRVQYGLAAANGISLPRTWFPGSAEEAKRLAAEVSYPAILKPYQAHVGRKKIGCRKVVVAQSAKALVDEYERLGVDGAEFMIQEIVPGDDTHLFGYLAFWDAEGRERAWLTKQKLRQSSAFGDGSLQVTVDAPEVAEQSRRLLRALDYRGFVGVEFRLDPRDGVYRLMEINPRTVSGNQLAIAAGVDFPWLGYRYLTDSAGTEPAASFRRGVFYVNEEWDFRAYLGLRKSGQLSFPDWLRSLAGAEARALWAWDDPGPLLALLGRFARAALRLRSVA
jgi:D-aspartate ligase